MTLEEKWLKEIEEWFDKESYFLQFTLVPPKSDIGSTVKQWMVESYLQACQKRQEDIDLLKAENKRLKSRENPTFDDYEPFDER